MSIVTGTSGYNHKRALPSFQAGCHIAPEAKTVLVQELKNKINGFAEHCPIRKKTSKNGKFALTPEKVVENFRNLVEKTTSGINGNILILLKENKLLLGYENDSKEQFFGLSSNISDPGDLLPNKRYDASTPGSRAVKNIVSRLYGVVKSSNGHSENPFEGLYNEMFKKDNTLHKIRQDLCQCFDSLNS